MQIVTLSAAGFFLITLGGLFVYVGLRSFTVNEISHRLHAYVSELNNLQTFPSTNYIHRKELMDPFGKRILLPWFKKLGRLFGRFTPTEVLETLGRQLAIAGNPLGLGPREFYGLRLIFTLIGFTISYLLLREGVNQTSLFGSALALYIGSFLPKLWLRRKMRVRKHKIQKGLPDALDMLSTCAEAGLGFDQSMQRVSQHWKTPLGLEFERVVKEMGMGLSRQAALRNLSNRLDITQLSSFVSVILQSDQLGMSIADTLYAQAEQMRVERRFRAQEQARKMPLKMLFPLMLLIFPAMFAVILGPMIPAFDEFFGTLLGSIYGY